MKYQLGFILSLSTFITIQVLGQQDLKTKCGCNFDQYMECRVKEHNNVIENCEKYQYDIRGEITCSLCKPGYAYDIDETQCVKHNVPNCDHGTLRPGSRDPYQTKGFACKKCSSNFYINNKGLCTENPDNIDNCINYSQSVNQVDEVLCVFCEENYWRQEDTLKNCRRTPATVQEGYIENCDIYFNGNGTAEGFYCLKCNEGYLIQQDNKRSCAEAPTRFEDGMIENCAAYLNLNGTAQGFVCLQCAQGFEVRQNSSISSCDSIPDTQSNGKIEHCVSYKNQNGTAKGWSCQDCGKNHVLNTQGSQCYEIPNLNTEPSTWTENCLKWGHDNAKFYCEQCDKNFYLKITGLGAKCLAVKLNITNCLVYDSPTQCSICEVNYWLENNECRQCLLYSTYPVNIINSDTTIVKRTILSSNTTTITSQIMKSGFIITVIAFIFLLL